VTADQAVTRAAGIAAFLARNGDRRGVARATEALSPAQLGDLVFTLAASADREPPPAPRPALKAHAEYKRLTSCGVERDEMPAWVVTGERAYQREAKRAHVARKAVAEASLTPQERMRAAREARLAEFARLRRLGCTIAVASARVRMSVATGKEYAAELKRRERERQVAA
jgi:hypothetical protein